MAEGTRKILGFSFARVLIPFITENSSRTSSVPNAPTSNMVILSINILKCEFWRNKNIQKYMYICVCVYKNISLTFDIFVAQIVSAFSIGRSFCWFLSLFDKLLSMVFAFSFCFLLVFHFLIFWRILNFW